MHQRTRRVRAFAILAALARRNAVVHGSRIRRPFSWFVTSSRAEPPIVHGVALSFLAGLVFGVGLIVSGMANPAKMLGFLDLAGKWDPSLALVMAGAIAVGVIGSRSHGGARCRRSACRCDCPRREPSTAARRGQPRVRRRMGTRRVLPGTGPRRARRGLREGRVFVARDARRHERVRCALRAQPHAPHDGTSTPDPDARSSASSSIRSRRPTTYLLGRPGLARGGADRPGVRAGAARRRAHRELGLKLARRSRRTCTPTTSPARGCSSEQLGSRSRLRSKRRRGRRPVPRAWRSRRLRRAAPRSARDAGPHAAAASPTCSTTEDGVHRRLPADPRQRPHRLPAGRRARAVPLGARARSSRCRPLPALSRRTTTAASRSPASARSGASIRAWAATIGEARLRRLHEEPRPAAPEADRHRGAGQPALRPARIGRSAARRPGWAPLTFTFAGIWEIQPDSLEEHARRSQIVDVREPDEFDGPLGRIGGAKLIPLGISRSEAPSSRRALRSSRSAARARARRRRRCCCKGGLRRCRESRGRHVALAREGTSGRGRARVSPRSAYPPCLRPALQAQAVRLADRRGSPFRRGRHRGRSCRRVLAGAERRADRRALREPRRALDPGPAARLLGQPRKTSTRAIPKERRWRAGSRRCALPPSRSTATPVEIGDTLFTALPVVGRPLLARADVERILERLVIAASPTDRKRWIWVYHAPPESMLSWTGKRHYGDAVLKAARSCRHLADRRAVRSHPPKRRSTWADRGSTASATRGSSTPGARSATRPRGSRSILRGRRRAGSRSPASRRRRWCAESGLLQMEERMKWSVRCSCANSIRPDGHCPGAAAGIRRPKGKQATHRVACFASATYLGPTLGAGRLTSSPRSCDLALDGPLGDGPLHGLALDGFLRDGPLDGLALDGLLHDPALDGLPSRWPSSRPCA